MSGVEFYEALDAIPFSEAWHDRLEAAIVDVMEKRIIGAIVNDNARLLALALKTCPPPDNFVGEQTRDYLDCLTLLTLEIVEAVRAAHGWPIGDRHAAAARRLRERSWTRTQQLLDETQ